MNQKKLDDVKVPIINAFNEKYGNKGYTIRVGAPDTFNIVIEVFDTNGYHLYDSGRILHPWHTQHVNADHYISGMITSVDIKEARILKNKLKDFIC